MFVPSFNVAFIKKTNIEMAKELPYFKFEPAEYLTKDISFCSLAAQGLFINLCSYYWQRECKLTKDQFLRRFKNELEFNELLNEGVFNVSNDGFISIKFLNIQYELATNKSLTNSENGSKGGRPKKAKINPNESEIKANGKPIESESKGIREEEIREDKNKIPTFIEFRDYAIEHKPLANIKDLKLKYDSWVANGWKDGNNKKIVNWKSKILNTLPFIKESTDTPVDQYAAHMRNLTRA
jgi:hypothetical protein